MKMKISAKISPAESARAEVLFFYEDGKIPAFWPENLKSLGKRYFSLVSKGGRNGSVTAVLASERTAWLLAAGLGKEMETSALRECCAEVVRQLKKLEIPSANLWFPEESDFEMSMAAAEGILLGSYGFNAYKKDETHCVEEMRVSFNGREEGTKLGIILAEAQIKARNLANEPGNVIGPSELADAARRVSASCGLECRIYDDREIREMGMSALWFVGKGSSRKPRLVHMVYHPEGSPRRRIAFVGKGVTFDSGGLSLKSHNGMLSMKSDKTGACNVIAIMEAVAKLKPDLEIHGIFGAVENMPDGGAYRPDDIIRAKNGKTIEIKSTDAEGRVTLADTLTYACEQKPDLLIDMATLTGAAATALGNYTAAALSDDMEAAAALIDAGKAEGERFHLFTMDDVHLRRQIDSPFADLKNSGGPGGGTITAGMFLREFVVSDVPWVHLDIAGVDFDDRAFGCYAEGCSAFGVRSCLRLILNF